ASAFMPIFKNMQEYKPSGVGHSIHYKTLQAAMADGGGKLSPILDDMPAGGFNNYLSKMLVMHGLDSYVGPEGHANSQLGNTGTDVLLCSQTWDCIPPAQASIDCVLANSSSFYKSSALLGRGLVWTGNEAEFNWPGSYWYADPMNKTTCDINLANANASPGA